MDITSLPPELLEKVFLNLDTQALSACALADTLFSDVIYSSHFLDEYCRTTLSSSWVSVVDICKIACAPPYEFWFWAYSTIKSEDSRGGNIIFHSKHLTKIGTFKHKYILWLMSGLRPSFIASYAVMNEIYPSPLAVRNVFQEIKMPKAIVLDTLLKVYVALPEIMDLTCSEPERFNIVIGKPSYLCRAVVLKDFLIPKLPEDFSTLLSVEILSSSVLGKHPTLLILIGENSWTLWLGFLFRSFDEDDDPNMWETVLYQHFSHETDAASIRISAHTAFLELVGYMYSMRNSTFHPFITDPNSESASVIMSIAQEHHRSLQRRFDKLFHKVSLELCKKMKNRVIVGDLSKDKVIEILSRKICSNLHPNKYLCELLKIDSKSKKSLSVNLHFVICRGLLERLTSLFRNEIHSCQMNNFSHSFLCGCIDPPGSGRSPHDTINRCYSEKLKEGPQSPHLWPSHVLSASCMIMSSLAQILEADVNMIAHRGWKYVIPSSLQTQVNNQLHTVGLVLTNRPPTKPRCPPLFKQVRLWTMGNFN